MSDIDIQAVMSLRYRPAAVTPWIAYALAFKAGRRRCTDGEQRLLFEEFEDEIEAAYLSAGLGPGANG